MIYAIFYTDKKFRKRAKPLTAQLLDVGFDKVIHYTREWLVGTEFYSENREILDMPRGSGYWLWKPFIILETMKNIKDGDSVFYIDAGDSPKRGIVDAIKKEGDYIISGHMLRPPNLYYTKRDCFILMGRDDCEYRAAPQVEAGNLVFKKSMKGFVEEWLGYCKDKHILTDIPNIHGANYAGFVEHRHDQSILTNLMVKHKMKHSEILEPHIKRNVFTP